MRKLASVQVIADVQPIDGADTIVKVRINDWWCVAKKGEFQVGDLCVYHEIDSLLPMGTHYDFLSPRGTKKSELEDGTIVEGYRLKTIKLRGQISQGLALPISIITDSDPFFFAIHDNLIEPNGVGTDVTSLLGVHKYEQPLSPQLKGKARGNFPSFLRKSDQERCQNLRKDIWTAFVNEDKFQVTVKLDGSSMTIFQIGEEQAENYGTESRFGVCSRNLELQKDEGNAFWSVALRDKMAETMQSLEKDYAMQGELISPSIQGNFEGVSRPDFYVYNMFDIKNQCWVSPIGVEDYASTLGLNHVPILHKSVTLRTLFPDATEDTIVQSLLTFADGPSAFGGKFREGLVFKREDGKFSFKAISNKYLLKTGE